MIGTSLLDTAIEWISENLEPTEVFDEKTLAEWATSNGYQEEE